MERMRRAAPRGVQTTTIIRPASRPTVMKALLTVIEAIVFDRQRVALDQLFGLRQVDLVLLKVF
jgi:putative NADH-flavin reductase